MRIEYHRMLIADRVRNAAFEAALRIAIRPGKTVVADIGAGTGLLGLMAHKLGARQVLLYEAAEVAGVARQVLKRNRAPRCHLVACHSTEMQDPPRVGVVVSETLGNYPFEENIIETLNDALRRHLKPGGTIIPRRLTQFVAPVVTDRFHRELTAWERLGNGLDFTPAQTMSLNNIYVRRICPDDLLAGGARSWDNIDFTRHNPSTRKGTVRWTFERPETLYGFATWWVAELVPGIGLSTAPDAPETHWEQLYFPMLRPIAAEADETVELSLRSRSSRSAGTRIRWTACKLNRAGEPAERLEMNLDAGFLP
jgi:hypothetical protein